MTGEGREKNPSIVLRTKSGEVEVAVGDLVEVMVQAKGDVASRKEVGRVIEVADAGVRRGIGFRNVDGEELTLFENRLNSIVVRKRKPKKKDS